MQGIDNATIYAEKMYSTNFTAANKKFCLSLHYNGYLDMFMILVLIIGLLEMIKY